MASLFIASNSGVQSYNVAVALASLVDESPVNGTTDVVVNSNIISCSVVDIAPTSIVLSSIEIYVNGVLGFSSSSFSSPWNGPAATFSSTSVSGRYGYNIVLDHTENFEYETLHTVRVVATNSVGTLDTTWTFTTEVEEIPPVVTDPFFVNQINVEIAGEVHILSTRGARGHGSSRAVSSRQIATNNIVQQFNQFDEHGSLLSLPRLRGESNYSYKRRIQSAAAYFANSSYRGLINGITRELGLYLSNPILINPKREGGAFLAPDPYILFDGVWLLLYSDYANRTLDWAIDRQQSGGNYEHINKLVDLVNTTSYFEASINPNIDEYTKSMTILNQSNRAMISMEFIPQSTKFKLEHAYLSTDEIFFSNRKTFREEVASEVLVNSSGKYYIDYTSGIVRVFNMPQQLEYVRYKYTIYPFKPFASPIILHDINSENFKIKMFQQVLNDDGTYAHGLPTEVGTDIINELMTVSPLYWGI